MLGFNNLSTDCGGSFFAAAVPSAVWAIDIVKSRDAALQAKVLLKVAAHSFAEQLFPSVTIFAQGRVGIFFFERHDIGTLLLVAVVDASGGRIKKALHTLIPGGHQHMRVDENAEHTKGAIGLDKAHSTHVGRELKHSVYTFCCQVAVVLVSQVERQVLYSVCFLVPLLNWFDVHGTDLASAPRLQAFHEMAPDESPGTTNDHSLSFDLHYRLLYEI